MERRWPPIALIWMHQGKNTDERRELVQGLDYPDFEIIEVPANGSLAQPVDSMSARAEICIFWFDDDKPVSTMFLKQMIDPLVVSEDSRAAMHFWSGNAVSVPRSLMGLILHIDNVNVPGNSLLQLLLPILDQTEKEPDGRVHIAVSSAERFAPLTLDPVGVVS